MRKTKLVLELERAYGKPLAQIVVEAYNAHGSIRAAAAALGVPPNTLYSWMVRLGISIRGQACHVRESLKV